MCFISLVEKWHFNQKKERHIFLVYLSLSRFSVCVAAFETLCMSLHVGHRERRRQLKMWSTLTPNPQITTFTSDSLMALCVRVCVWLWQLPGFSLLSKVPHPLLKYVWLRPSPTPQPISLDSGLLLVLSCRNADCWLEGETEKEALGVFIETLSFTRTITTIPHRERETERDR